MVKLKRCSEMSVLKNITIRVGGLEETEVWVALMKTAISLNSVNPLYDGFYYKKEIVIKDICRNQLSLEVTGGRNLLLKFGSKETMEAFCKNIDCIEASIEGIKAPCSSPASSPSPSPPRTTPSPPSSSS